jgi:hypothetical protein
MCFIIRKIQEFLKPRKSDIIWHEELIHDQDKCACLIMLFFILGELCPKITSSSSVSIRNAIIEKLASDMPRIHDFIDKFPKLLRKHLRNRVKHESDLPNLTTKDINEFGLNLDLLEIDHGGFLNLVAEIKGYLSNSVSSCCAILLH